MTASSRSEIVICPLPSQTSFSGSEAIALGKHRKRVVSRTVNIRASMHLMRSLILTSERVWSALGQSSRKLLAMLQSLLVTGMKQVGWKSVRKRVGHSKVYVVF